MEKAVKRKIEETAELEEESIPRPKVKSRGRKRKRVNSDSSTDLEDALPENALEMEKSLHASAIKNNLDDESVKKILKKVVTNDHVLALVKIREEEEEEACSSPEANAPKLTRAKAKELMKSSPKSAPWNLALTPIKRIPVKTRPEVEALMAHELPEDEPDDEEYEPTNEDVPSDDDQTLESCSDLDSQPRTPATPSSQPSPRVLHDGPFKVPPPTTPARRKLHLPEEDEQATIALRTRSKINLSSTTIEHIESSFVPPDDVPPPRDEEWDQFLSGVFDPTGFREEDDPDETDPEYNVAADPDANDEDDLEGSILRISKKELNDLVTELFSIMPEAAVADELADHLAKDVLTDTQHTQISSKWEGKQEQLSDEDNEQRPPKSQERRDSTTKVSLGKSEIDPCQERLESDEKTEDDDAAKARKSSVASVRKKPTALKRSTTVDVTVEESCFQVMPLEDRAPPPLLRGIKTQASTNRVEIRVDEASKIEVSPEQRAVLQQQMRQHVQLAASNFLQLFVNPLHWTMAPQYRQYLEQLGKMVESNPSSVVNVCNLQPALELIKSWEESVSQDTPENRQMVEFIQKEAERSHRRFKNNSMYTGDFPEAFQHVVANSNVFLYPYLLPAMPYRIERYRKYGYRLSEDELIAIGLEQFWQYLADNPSLYAMKQPPNPRTRVGFNATVTLLCKYMMPWMAPKLMLHHIMRARKDKDNPIHRFFQSGEVVAVKHKLLPYNPALTLYEQPEHEMPRIWVRYLAKSSKRFRNFLHHRKTAGLAPIEGVFVDIGSKSNIEAPKKNPLPIDFTKTIVCTRNNLLPKVTLTPLSDKYDLEIEKTVTNGNLDAREQPIQAVNDNIEKDSKSDKELHHNVQSKLITFKSSLFNKESQSNNANNLITGEKTIRNKSDKCNKETETTAPSGTIEESRSKTTIVVQNSNNHTDNVIGTPLISQNLFKVIETSTGSFLVPFTVVQTTSTVDSIKGPISSVQEGSILNNDVPEPKKDRRKEDSENHCQCCLMLRKICKEKQMKITDYFNPKKEETCRCSHRKYPKVSKRLKMLVNNYKIKTFCVHRELRQKLNLVKKEVTSDTTNLENVEANDSGYDLDDIEFVTSYQLKVINRTNITRNNYIKKRVTTLFSKFDTEDGNAIYLSEQLFKAFEVDLVDLYQEFLGFLTAEQADKIDKFKDYFVQRCVRDLMKEIEQEVTDSGAKQQILSRISDIFFDRRSTSCELCCYLLDGVCRYPRLARVVFDMFPHKTVVKEDGTVVREDCRQSCSCTSNTQPVPSEQQTQIEESRSPLKAAEEVNTTDARTKVDSEAQETDSNVSENETLTVIDYGADNSDSDDSHDDEMTVMETTDTTQTDVELQKTPDATNPHPEYDRIHEDTELTVTKTEVDADNDSETTEMSALVMSEDESIKIEPAEWTREEDKFILQLLLQHLSPEQRQGRTIMEIVEEQKLVEIVSDSLPEKSLDDIKERVMCIIGVLVMTD